MAEAKERTERNSDAGQKDKEEGEAKKRGYNFNKGHRVASKKFEGKCDELNGAIFDCSESKMADTRLTSNSNCWSDEIVGDAVTMVGKQMAGFNENIKKLYALVWGQCTDMMQQKLESSAGWDEIWRSGDGLKLLILIKNIAYAFQSQNYPGRAIHEAKKRYFNLMQNGSTTLKEHLTVFNNLVDVLEHTGGNIDDDVGMERYVLNGRDKAAMTPAELGAMKAEVRDRILGVAFMLTCDRARFGKYIEGINNDYNEGNARYPNSRADAFHRLSNYQNNPRLGQREVGGEGEIAFVNADSEKLTKGQTQKQGAHNVSPLQKKGHYANECDGERVAEGDEKSQQLKQPRNSQARRYSQVASTTLTSLTTKMRLPTMPS
ncbi:hypothetical protein MHU86_19207 [Fragilaria crotonensis]|nr:hypothetical protein MHU86_19207 [Fragilaria crotonensis]